MFVFRRHRDKIKPRFPPIPRNPGLSSVTTERMLKILFFGPFRLTGIAPTSAAREGRGSEAFRGAPHRLAHIIKFTYVLEISN